MLNVALKYKVIGIFSVLSQVGIIVTAALPLLSGDIVYKVGKDDLG
jgi:hypothetical protein